MEKEKRVCLRDRDIELILFLAEYGSITNENVKLLYQSEYYYKNSDKKDDLWDNMKRQTRYTSQFVYIYDEQKVELKNKDVIVVSCPNCGAPLSGLNGGECTYCSSHFEPINLKLWKMSSYKEDYK